MCGIFGYSGTKKTKDTIFNGLKRLEYRGYDSWGIAILNEGKIYQYKNIGEIEKNKGLTKLHDGTVGIGHTRWATMGVTTKMLIHIYPLTKISLVQNGIVENFDSLKKDLLKKERHLFLKQTQRLLLN